MTGASFQLQEAKWYQMLRPVSKIIGFFISRSTQQSYFRHTTAFTSW